MSDWRAGVGISVVEGQAPGTQAFDDLATLALRRNPKRAQLIISRVLAKHLPVSGRVARNAAHALLVAVLLEAKHGPLRGNHRTWLKMSRTTMPSVGPATIIGLAETATGLAGCVADFLPGCNLLTTTRDQSDHPAVWLRFEEPHSHAPSHLVLSSAQDLLSEPQTVFIIDDEISSGHTAANLIRALSREFPTNQYAVGSLVDASVTQGGVTQSLTNDERWFPLGRLAKVHLTVHQDLPEWIYQSQGQFDKALAAPTDDMASKASKWVDLGRFPGTVPDMRYGVRDWRADRCEALLNHVGRLATCNQWSDLLVLGAEEWMHLPIRIAASLEADVQSSSRSPIVIWNREGYPIRSGFTFPSLFDPHNDSYLYRSVNTSEPTYGDVLVVLPDDLSDGPGGLGLMWAAGQIGLRAWLLRVPRGGPFGAVNSPRSYE